MEFYNKGDIKIIEKIASLIEPNNTNPYEVINKLNKKENKELIEFIERIKEENKSGTEKNKNVD